jgi:hypothetical protein
MCLRNQIYKIDTLYFLYIIETMTIITILPIELWNIIFTFSNYDDVRNLMYIMKVYKVFEPLDLDGLKLKYIYDYIISSSPINKIIYSIYNNLDSINTKQKYINYYSKLYYKLDTLDSITINIKESFMLRNYLSNKIEKSKVKQKYNNLTKKLISVSYKKDQQTKITNILKYIN